MRNIGLSVSDLLRRNTSQNGFDEEAFLRSQKEVIETLRKETADESVSKLSLCR